MKANSLSDYVWVMIGVASFVIAGVLVLATLFGPFRPYYYGYYGMMGSYGMGLFPIVWFGAIALVILLVYLLFSLTQKGYGPDSTAKPKDILKKRLATGEISRDEFEERIAALDNSEDHHTTGKKVD